MASRIRAMIVLVSLVCLGLAGPITVASYAAVTPTNQAECEKAGMRWKPKVGKCKQMPRRILLGERFGIFGLICAIAALMLLFQDWIRRQIGIPARDDAA
jgi:hypothetical protein